MLWRRRERGQGGGRVAPAEPERSRPRQPQAPGTRGSAEPSAVEGRTAPGLASRYANLRSSLGPDTSVSGRLSFTVPTRIDGTFRGEVRATDILVVGETGYVEGTVRAARLVVLGKVQAEVLGCERVEVGPRGSLEGFVETRSLLVEHGGRADARCRVAPAKATVHLLHPGRTRAGEGEPGEPKPAVPPEAARQ